MLSSCGGLRFFVYFFHCFGATRAALIECQHIVATSTWNYLPIYSIDRPQSNQVKPMKPFSRPYDILSLMHTRPAPPPPRCSDCCAQPTAPRTRVSRDDAPAFHHKSRGGRGTGTHPLPATVGTIAAAPQRAPPIRLSGRQLHQHSRPPRGILPPAMVPETLTVAPAVKRVRNPGLGATAFHSQCRSQRP